MKKILLSLLGLFVFLSIGNITQAATPEACFKFQPAGKYITEYYSNEGDDTSNPACPKDVDIPAQIGGVDVEEIGAHAFFGRDITSVIIPDTVKVIGTSAFAYNQIQSLTLGNGVTQIGMTAFEENQIQSLTIPDSVTTIGTQAFGENKIQSLTLGNGVTTIGTAAFAENQIQALNIPNSVTTIEYRAFKANQIGTGGTVLTLPDSLTQVGAEAFSGNAVNPVPGEVSWDPTDPANTQKKEDIEGTVADGDVSFLKLQQAVTNESCFNFDTTSKTITDYYDNEGNVGTNPACPRDVNIPAQIAGVDVEVIGDNAFNTKNITSVIIPDTVTTLGLSAFANNQIQNLTLPDSVVMIGDDVFNSNLIDSITIPDSVQTIGEYAFISNQIQNLTLGKSVTTIGAYAFDGNQIGTGGTTLVIPDSVTTIGEYAFAYNQIGTGGTTLVIPNSVTMIGTAAFYDNQIQNLTLGKSVTTIGDGAFYNNQIGTGGTVLTLPDSLTQVGADAFSGNAVNPVPGEVSWDPADPGNAQKKEDIEGTVADGDVSFLKLQQKITSGGSSGGGSSSSVGPGGSSSSSSSPTVTIDESATEETQTGEVVTPQPKPIVKPKDEMKQAYGWSYTRGITTMNTLEKARVHDTITRAELAKMISVYAVKELKKKKRNNTIPKYTDTQNIHGDLKDYITLSYQLGLMGRNPDGTPLKNFHPNSQVTRAEFATVLSRLLYGDKYENLKGHFYTKHIQALKDNAILTNTTPNMKEKRGWIMLMLMRSQKK